VKETVSLIDEKPKKVRKPMRRTLSTSLHGAPADLALKEPEAPKPAPEPAPEPVVEAAPEAVAEWSKS